MLGDNVVKLYEELHSPTESLSGRALGPPECRLYSEETAGAFASSQQVSELQDGESIMEVDGVEGGGGPHSAPSPQM